MFVVRSVIGITYQIDQKIAEVFLTYDVNQSLFDVIVHFVQLVSPDLHTWLKED
jgi:hypothetical protein